MQIFTQRQGALLCFWLSLLFVAANFCYGDHSTVEVVGLGECADCKENNIKTSQAFSGLRVTVDCKGASGHFETRGVGKLDENGKFKVSLPHDIVKAEEHELKEECYAQLHSAAAAPCPAHDGLGNTKIVLKSKADDKHTLGPVGKLKFSSVTCPSAFSSSFHKHPLLPKLPHPPLTSPPIPPKVKPPLPPLPPKVQPPLSPLPPKVKPCPPPKAMPPLPPKVKPPLPPLPPKVVPPPLPPPVPIYKKPLPPLPPFPKLPPFKTPPLPKIPPKHSFHHHPKFGKWPPHHP